MGATVVVGVGDGSGVGSGVVATLGVGVEGGTGVGLLAGSGDGVGAGFAVGRVTSWDVGGGVGVGLSARDGVGVGVRRTATVDVEVGVRMTLVAVCVTGAKVGWGGMGVDVAAASSLTGVGVASASTVFAMLTVTVDSSLGDDPGASGGPELHPIAANQRRARTRAPTVTMRDPLNMAIPQTCAVATPACGGYTGRQGISLGRTLRITPADSLCNQALMINATSPAKEGGPRSMVLRTSELLAILRSLFEGFSSFCCYPANMSP